MPHYFMRQPQIGQNSTEHWVLVHNNTIYIITLFITYLERAYKYDYFEYRKHMAEMIIREKYFFNFFQIFTALSFLLQRHTHLSKSFFNRDIIFLCHSESTVSHCIIIIEPVEFLYRVT